MDIPYKLLREGGREASDPTPAPALPASVPAPVAAGAAKPRYVFLDGFRGLLALWVVLCHLVSRSLQQVDTSSRGGVFEILMGGHDRVTAFFLLSGFCLMIPAVRRKGALRDGASGFLRRRFWRIVPTYYAAIALILLCHTLAHAAKNGLGSLGSLRENECFRPDVLISHLLLVHNYSFELTRSLSAPLWTIAIEWQLYFVFVLILLPLWRLASRQDRWAAGLLGLTGGAALLGYAPYALLPPSQNFSWTYPHLVLAFALGMAGAVLALSTDDPVVALRRRVPAGVVALVFLGLVWVARAFGVKAPTAIDPLWSLAVLGMILMCFQNMEREGERCHWLRRFLESRPLLALGTISYSLFLTHFGLHAMVVDGLKRLRIEGAPLAWGTFALGLAGSLALAVVFYRTCEKPFSDFVSRMK